jgi:hypothetical protein
MDSNARQRNTAGNNKLAQSGGQGFVGEESLNQTFVLRGKVSVKSPICVNLQNVSGNCKTAKTP